MSKLLEEVMQTQKRLNAQIAQLAKEIEKEGGAPAPQEKRPSARRAPQAEQEPPREATKGPKTAKGVSLAKFQPVPYGKTECVCGPQVKKEFLSYSFKLQGKDEILVVWCPEHECAHYFLAQPKGEVFEVFELRRGLLMGKVDMTPSGDLDTETALEELEEKVGDSE